MSHKVPPKCIKAYTHSDNYVQWGDAPFPATLAQLNSVCCIWKWSVAHQNTQPFRMWAVRDIWCVITLPEGDAVIVRMGRARRLPFNFARCCFFRKREKNRPRRWAGPCGLRHWQADPWETPFCGTDRRHFPSSGARRDASPKTSSCNKNTLYGRGINEINKPFIWLHVAVNTGLRMKQKTLTALVGFWSNLKRSWFFFSPRKWVPEMLCVRKLFCVIIIWIISWPQHWFVFGQRQIQMDVVAAWRDKELLSAASALCKDRTRRRFSGLPQLIGLQSESLLGVGIRGNKINKITTQFLQKEGNEY